MNYNDKILEPKTFNFCKQLIYNIALSVCIILLGALIMVNGFKYQLYEVITNSQAPYFDDRDIVIVKSYEDYKVGDILTFNQGANKVSHRLVAIFTEKSSGKIYYVCHGDNNGASNPALNHKVIPWEEEAKYVASKIDENTTANDLRNHAEAHDLQVVQMKDIHGKVVAVLNNYRAYVNTIRNHAGLFITIVAGIWCFSTVVQNELEIKRARRLL